MTPLNAKKFLNGVLIDFAADDAQAACVIRRTIAQFVFAGHIVKVQPFAVRQRQNALCAQDGAKAVRIVQRFQRLANDRFLKALGRFHTDIFKYLIRMVVAMMIVTATAVAFMAVFMLVIVVVFVIMAAGAFMLMLVFVIMAAGVFMFMLVICLLYTSPSPRD